MKYALDETLWLRELVWEETTPHERTLQLQWTPVLVLGRRDHYQRQYLVQNQSEAEVRDRSWWVEEDRLVTEPEKVLLEALEGL